MKKLTAAFLLIAILLTGCARNPKPKEPPKEFLMRGEVKALDPKDQLATVDHEKIEGWMDAMTMQYPVRNPDAFAKLKVGEKIEAKIVVQGLEYWIADVKETAPPSP